MGAIIIPHNYFLLFNKTYSATVSAKDVKLSRMCAHDVVGKELINIIDTYNNLFNYIILVV